MVFVHGIGGSSDDFALMGERLERDGWPADRLYYFQAENARWTCNVDNAAAIAALVAEARQGMSQSTADTAVLSKWMTDFFLDR